MPRRPGWVLLRSVLLVLAWITFYASLPVMSLVRCGGRRLHRADHDRAALGGADQGTGHPVAMGRRPAGLPRRRSAIVKPGTDAFSWFTILPLLCAAFYALAMVLTRSKCRDEAPLALGLALHVCFVATGLIATAILALARARRRNQDGFSIPAWRLGDRWGCGNGA